MSSITLSAPWSSLPPLVVDRTTSDRHWMTPILQGYQFGGRSQVGTPRYVGRPKVMTWRIDAYLRGDQWSLLVELAQQQAARLEARQDAHVVMVDRVNLYPQSQHLLNSRSVVSGSSVVNTAGITVAHLAFPALITLPDGAFSLMWKQGECQAAFELEELP